MQARVAPYVVEVDRLGEARSVAPAIQNYKPTDGQVAWHLSRFISNVRSVRSEEHTSELQSLMRISYAVFCLKKTSKTLSLQDNHVPHILTITEIHNRHK